MKVAIMQPYFLPYIGYFQLMHAVDVFVCFDDVQYINRGWVNRNRILVRGRPNWVTMPVVKANRKDSINKRCYVAGTDAKDAIKRQLEAAYCTTPHKRNVLPLLVSLINYDERNVAKYNMHLLGCLAEILGIKCDVRLASDFNLPKTRKGQDRVIDICRLLGANTYINPRGGMELYNINAFERAGIRLFFLGTTVAPLCVNGDGLHLSIVDTLFNHGIEATRVLLDDFQLIQG
ncbi:MAG: WbqC family protein [Nitrosospira sp.]|nr:WbqC family protein [Nitrosospira sp.]